MELGNIGCRHSSVDSSAPSNLQPRVRIPSTISMLYLLLVTFGLYSSFHCEKNEKKTKRGWFGSFGRPANLARLNETSDNFPACTQLADLLWKMSVLVLIWI